VGRDWALIPGRASALIDNPQNRPFKHPNPIEWTRTHRAKILRALYTILIYGCRNRPANQVSKTRFKDWYDLCGWPIECAASLIGKEIDCAVLLDATESQDSEACAAATLLSELIDTFGANEFTAKEVTALIEAGTPKHFDPPSPAAKEKTDKLLDAFADLIGKPLRRYSSGTIGKLLNNRLVDLPTFVDDTVVTLRAQSEKHLVYYSITSGFPDGGDRSVRTDHSFHQKGVPVGLGGDGGDSGDVLADPESSTHIIPRDDRITIAAEASEKHISSDLSSAELSQLSPPSPPDEGSAGDPVPSGPLGNHESGQRPSAELVPVVPGVPSAAGNGSPPEVPNGLDPNGYARTRPNRRAVLADDIRKYAAENPKLPPEQIGKRFGVSRERVKKLLGVRSDG
jgi:hypothetical protein